jgi:hypothetical protein
MNRRQLLSRNTNFLLNSELIPEKMAHLGYTASFKSLKFKYENTKMKLKEAGLN